VVVTEIDRSAHCRRPWRDLKCGRSIRSSSGRTSLSPPPATGTSITADHMARMKNKAIVSNIGHFDNEIDMAGLKKYAGVKRVNIKPQYDEWVFPDGHSVLILARGD